MHLGSLCVQVEKYKTPPRRCRLKDDIHDIHENNSTRNSRKTSDINTGRCCVRRCHGSRDKLKLASNLAGLRYGDNKIADWKKGRHTCNGLNEMRSKNITSRGLNDGITDWKKIQRHQQIGIADTKKRVRKQRTSTHGTVGGDDGIERRNRPLIICDKG